MFPWKQLRKFTCHRCSYPQFTLFAIFTVLVFITVHQNLTEDRAIIQYRAQEELALDDVHKFTPEQRAEIDPLEEIELPPLPHTTQRVSHQARGGGSGSGTSRPPRSVTVHLGESQTTRHTTPTPVLVSRIDDLHRPPYLFIYNLGRFGNHLFQFASTYGIARATNRTAMLYPIASESLRQYFKGITVPTMTIPEKMQVNRLQEEYSGKFQPWILERLGSDDTELCCFLQSWRYFQQYEADLRRQLVFHDEIVTETRQELQDFIDRHIEKMSEAENQAPSHQSTPENFTVISVHIRRQDVAADEQLVRGYKPAPASYFHRAMDFYRQRHKNPLFIILGDDLVWARMHLSTSPAGLRYTDVEFRTGMAETDFPLLASCDHAVVSVGTYGWWGAWLAGGTVVYYNNWPTPVTEISIEYDVNDYYPSHWVGIGD